MFTHIDDTVQQSETCRITELTGQLAAVTRERDSLRLVFAGSRVTTNYFPHDD